MEASKSRDISLSICELVRCEFTKSRSKEAILKKADFLHKLVKYTLPEDKQVYARIQSTIEEYGSDIEGVSVTDIILACFIQRYSGLHLLTRNHSDFPNRIFMRSNFFHVGLDKEIKTYALYQYKPKTKELEVEIYDAPF